MVKSTLDMTDEEVDLLILSLDPLLVFGQNTFELRDGQQAAQRLDSFGRGYKLFWNEEKRSFDKKVV